jgi:hypothetical protein
MAAAAIETIHEPAGVPSEWADCDLVSGVLAVATAQFVVF